MVELILKQANDQMYCLFRWNSAQKTISKIAEGKICKKLDKYGSKVLLGNTETDCQVYMHKNGKLQVIPVCCQTVVFVDNICTYERQGKWYAYISGKEILLGERYKLNLSIVELCKSDNGTCHYFVSDDGTEKYVLSLVYQSKLFQGSYCGELYKLKEDYLIAERKDGNYDIINQSGLLVYDDAEKVKRYFSDDKKRIYFWDETKVSWKKIAEEGFVLAANALITYYKDENNQSRSILYEVNGTALTEKARGKFEVYRDGSFEVDGVIFTHDYVKDYVDFENRSYSFRRRLENLFAKKKSL